MIWPALLFVGVLTGVTFGALLMLLFRDRRREPSLPVLPAANLFPIMPYH